MVAGLTFKSVLHLELIAVHGVRRGLVSFFTREYLIFPAPFIEETVLSSLSIPCQIHEFFRAFDSVHCV